MFGASRAGDPRQPQRVRGGLSEAEALQLLQVLVRLAEALLSSGASAADVTATTVAVAHRDGLATCQVDVTFTSVTVSTVREDGTPLTVLRTVPERETDYGRLAHLYALARTAEGLPVPEVELRLREALSRPRLYHPVTARAAAALLAAAVAVLLGGSAAEAVVAALTTAAVQVVLAAGAASRLPAFFTQAAGAALATLVAVALLLGEPWLPPGLELRPALVVGSGIVVLLAGLSLVGSVEDAIGGYYVTASARTFETVLMTTGIVVGIAGVLDLAQRWGLVLPLLTPAPPAHALPVAVVAAGAASGAWAVSGHAGRRAAVLSALAGGAGWLVLEALERIGTGPGVASAGAALVIGVLAQRLGPRQSAPPVVVATCAIVPLLPGLAIYRAIFVMTTVTPAAGLGPLVEALGVALALAAGVTLGAWLAAPAPTRARRQRVRRAHPSRGQSSVV